MSSDRSHSPSNAERFLPIKLPRSLRGEERETDKENGSKYSKIVINLPGIEGTTVTRRNTFHPTDAFHTPMRPLQRPAVTSPRGNKTLNLVHSAARSPLVRLQRLRELAQQRLVRDSPIDTTDQVSTLPHAARFGFVGSAGSEDVAGRNVSFALEAGADVASDRSNTLLNGFSAASSGERAQEHVRSPVERMRGNAPVDLSGTLADAVFSRPYVEKLRQDHYDRVEELEGLLASKTREIKGLLDRCNELENSVADLQDSVAQKQNRLNVAIDRQAMLDEELRFRAAEVLSLKLEIARHERIRKDLEDDVARLKKEIAVAAATADGLQDESSQLRRANHELEDAVQEAEGRLALSKAVVAALQEEKRALSESLDSAAAGARSLERDLSTAHTELSRAKEDVAQLTATVAEKETAQRMANEKLLLFIEETGNIHNEMAMFEREYKQLEGQLQEKSDQIDELQAQETRLRAQVDALDRLRVTAEAEIHTLRDSVAQLQLDKRDLAAEADASRSQNMEKDEIISGDTKKLGELVVEIDELKKQLAAKSRQHESERPSDMQAQQRISSLQQQIALAQEKTEERIQEVAEQLYHQYSKKHEVKVGQLKRKYEVRLEENKAEMEAQRRKIETLERLLLAESKDKNHLLMLLEDKELPRK